MNAISYCLLVILAQIDDETYDDSYGESDAIQRQIYHEIYEDNSCRETYTS